VTFTLDRVVLWGRSYEEYAAMFALTARDLRRGIIGCGDGPAGFNADLSRRGGRVVSVDPVYALQTAEIQSMIAASYETIMEQTRRNSHEFVWKHIQSVEELGRIRMAAMERFLEDYPRGRTCGRYIPAVLPRLPFRDNAFGLALCSHYLFLYSGQLDAACHVRAIREMCRVAGEARVFPLLELGAYPSRHIGGVITRLKAEGFSVQVECVDYEFQRGGNKMLRVTRAH